MLLMRAACFILAVAIAGEAASVEPSAAKHLSGKVVGVYDGDCITLLADDRPVKVRLAGIDAPELGQAFGQAAKQRLSELAFGRAIEITISGTDRYGRTIGDFEIGGRSAAEQMVADGLAWHYKRYSDADELAAAESAARDARRGLWADPKPVPPWEWRRHEKAGKAAAGAP
jgi:micrococcal nuclease